MVDGKLGLTVQTEGVFFRVSLERGSAMDAKSLYELTIVTGQTVESFNIMETGRSRPVTKCIEFIRLR